MNRNNVYWLIDQIQNNFDNYKVSFDLEDCDLIMVTECITGEVQASRVISFLMSFGCNAEVLQDEVY